MLHLLFLIKELKNILPYRIKSLFLLGLFLFALTAQGVHQLETPATDLVDCNISDKHFHSDPDNHSCELCDYQITYWVGTWLNPQPWPRDVVVITLSTQDAPSLRSVLSYPLRGPPTR